MDITLDFNDHFALTRIRRIAATISTRLVGFGTSNEPMN